jgi:hypothetical protein
MPGVGLTCGAGKSTPALRGTHRPQPPVRAAATLAQPSFDHPQQDVQHCTDRLRFVLQKIGCSMLRYVSTAPSNERDIDTAGRTRTGRHNQLPYFVQGFTRQQAHAF